VGHTTDHRPAYPPAGAMSILTDAMHDALLALAEARVNKAKADVKIAQVAFAELNTDVRVAPGYQEQELLRFRRDALAHHAQLIRSAEEQLVDALALLVIEKQRGKDLREVVAEVLHEPKEAKEHATATARYAEVMETARKRGKREMASRVYSAVLK
jgi:hypothetical protein